MQVCCRALGVVGTCLLKDIDRWVGVKLHMQIWHTGRVTAGALVLCSVSGTSAADLHFNECGSGCKGMAINVSVCQCLAKFLAALSVIQKYAGICYYHPAQLHL